jgi:hypothetical protein
MPNATLKLAIDAAPAIEAIEELKLLAQDFPEAVELLLHSDFGFAELLRVDSGFRSAVRTGEQRILLEPSERLREFLIARRARDVGGEAVEV